MAYAYMDEDHGYNDFDDFEEVLRTGHRGVSPPKRAPGIGESPERHRRGADDNAKIRGAAPEVPTDSPYGLQNLSAAISSLPSGPSPSATLIERRKTSYHKKDSSMSAPAEKPLFEVGEIRIARRITQKASSPSIRRPKTSPARQPDTPRTPLSPSDGVESVVKAGDWQTRSGMQSALGGGLLSPSDCHSPARKPVQVVKISQDNKEAAGLQEASANGSADRSTSVNNHSLQAEFGALTPTDSVTPRGRSPQGLPASTASLNSQPDSVTQGALQFNHQFDHASIAIGRPTLEPTPVQLFRSNSARSEKGNQSGATVGLTASLDRQNHHAPCRRPGSRKVVYANRQDQQLSLGRTQEPLALKESKYLMGPPAPPTPYMPSSSVSASARSPQTPDIQSGRPTEEQAGRDQILAFHKAVDAIPSPRLYAETVSPPSRNGDRDPQPEMFPPFADASCAYKQQAPRHIDQTRQSGPLQPQAARQALLRPEDIKIEEAIVIESHSTLFRIRRRIVSAVPDLSPIGKPTASHTRFDYAKSLREAESRLAAREADLTIEALSRTETASVEMSIYTEQREGQWLVRGPAPADVKRVDVLPSVLDVWKVPLDTKSIVERGKLKSTLELAKTRRAIPCSECISRSRPDGQCPRCAGTEYIETIFVITVTLRVSSFGSLKLPACHLAGIVLPGVKYTQSPSEAVRSALLREQAINTVLRAARRVGQEHYEAHGAHLLMAKAKVERRGRMAVRVTSARTGAQRCFDVGDEGGEIVEVSETGVTIAVVEPAPLAASSSGPTHYFSISQAQSSRPSTAQSSIQSPSRVAAAGTGRRPATSGSEVRFRESSRKSRYSTQIERPAPGPGFSATHGPRPSTASNTNSSLSFSQPSSRSEVRPARFLTSSRQGSLASLRSEGSGRLSPVGEQGSGSCGRDTDGGGHGQAQVRRRSDETVRASRGTVRKPDSGPKTGKGIRRLFSRG